MTTTTFPPYATRPDLFGIVHAALLPALKDADVRVVWVAEEAGVVLVSTPFLLLRTVASEALLARHPVEVSPRAVAAVRARLASLEAGRVLSRLRVTNTLVEGVALLARQCLTDQDEPIFLNTAFLHLFGIERGEDALGWQLDLLTVDAHLPTQRRVVRLSRETRASGYFMPTPALVAWAR